MVKTSHYEIFEYWKDKWITPTGEISNIPTSEKSIPVITDWGEPCCWCCKKPIIHPSEIDYQSNSDYKKIWGNDKIKQKLQRSHIVPDALGGVDEPSNLFLLCSRCHELSPDTTNYKSFIRYIYATQRESFYGVNLNELSKCIQTSISSRFPMIDCEKVVEQLNRIIYDDGFEKLSKGFMEYAFNHSTIHRSDGGPVTAMSTATEVLMDYLLSEYLNKLGIKARANERKLKEAL